MEHRQSCESTSTAVTCTSVTSASLLVGSRRQESSCLSCTDRPQSRRSSRFPSPTHDQDQYAAFLTCGGKHAHTKSVIRSYRHTIQVEWTRFKPLCRVARVHSLRIPPVQFLGPTSRQHSPSDGAVGWRRLRRDGTPADASRVRRRAPTDGMDGRYWTAFNTFKVTSDQTPFGPSHRACRRLPSVACLPVACLRLPASAYKIKVEPFDDIYSYPSSLICIEIDRYIYIYIDIYIYIYIYTQSHTYIYIYIYIYI